jgi:peptidoglycan/LPS O-acetylase OafA/YrhL
MMRAAPAASDRISELDSLRGIAAMVVLAFHFTGWHPFLVRKQWGMPYIWWGICGVDLFFVISGFVILMTASRGSLHRFVDSRIARLFPAYWFCAVLSYLVVRAHDGVDFARAEPVPGIWDAVFNLTMLQYFFGIEAIDGSYWTLAYELSFYLALGVLLATSMLGRLEECCLAWLLVGAIAAQLTLPTWLNILLMVGYSQLFVAGMMIYRYWSGTARWLSAPTLAAAVGFCVWRPAGGHLPILQLGAVVAVGATVRWQPAVLRWWPLTFLGIISYPLYLIHQNIGYVELYWLDVVGVSQIPNVVVTTLTMLALAWLIQRYVETPGRRALRRLLSARTPKHGAPLNREG